MKPSLIQIMPIIWLALAVVMCVIEAATIQMVSIWFAIAAVISFVVSLFHAPIWVQLIVFVVASVATLLSARPFVKKYIKPRIIRTNADAIIGETAVVISPVNNLDMKGRVAIKGLDWAAISENSETFSEGEQVVIKKIDGVKLVISKK